MRSEVMKHEMLQLQDVSCMSTTVYRILKRWKAVPARESHTAHHVGALQLGENLYAVDAQTFST